ncbi:MCE family protein [Nocardioides sp. LML1-1-1.1]|uniref:MCE family protein n=1 Tax=Nocardioides sp. LML1-1-1.1 TaxID=3135248 RepID=UPI003413F113
MKPMNERDPLKIGIITIIVIGLIGAAVVVLSVANFGTKTYTAELEHTAGLRKGESVQVHGVESGKVTGIELQDDHVLVTFALDSGIDLGSRSSAKVKVATLLGTHYLEVDPHGTGSLADDRIPMERTSVPYNLQDVLEEGTDAIEELDPDLLAKALTTMAGTLGASEQEIGPALQGVARLSEVISRRSDQVGDLLASARKVTDQLSASSQDIVGLMKQTNLVISEITARREAIHRLLLATTDLAQSLNAVVKSTEGKINPALRNLNTVIATLNGQSKQLTHVLDVMAPALRYLANATGSGPFIPLYIDDRHGPGLLPDDCALKFLGVC